MKQSKKLLLMSIALFSAALSSCSGDNPSSNPASGDTTTSPTSTPSGSSSPTSDVPVEDKIRDIYNLYLEAGGTQTYEEWLASIKGDKGDAGSAIISGSEDPKSSIGKNGDFFVNTTSWDVFLKKNDTWSKLGNIMGSQGETGQDGKSAYQIYCEAHPEYQGSEDQWLDDLINGRLGNKEVHTVTFDSHGGSKVESQEILHGEKASKPQDPTRAGYTFDGWTYQEEPWVFYGYVVTEDITLDANWTAIDYVATFQNEDGTVLEIQDPVHYGDVLTYHGETPVKPNPEAHYAYTFMGWDKDLVVKGDMTFTAQFSSEFAPYTAYFYDENDNLLYSTLVKEEESATYVGDEPTKADDNVNQIQYQFSGWDETSRTEDTITYKPHFESCTKGLLFEENSVYQYIGTSKFVTIPASWNGYKITTLSDRCFESSAVQDVFIPDSVTYIGQCAFNACSSLTSITIPDSVTYIGYDAFSFAVKDAYIRISDILKVMLMEGKEYLGGKIHLLNNDGNEMTEIVLPNGITYVNYRAFYNCAFINSIVIPDSVTTIYSYAFANCSSLTSIIIPHSVEQIVNYTFQGCSSLEAIDIPEGVTSIGYCAFAYCDSLTSITIPSSVIQIDSGAFENSPSLTVYCEAEYKPKDWASGWDATYMDGCNITVIWGYKETVEENGYVYALGNASGYLVATVVDFDENIVDFDPAIEVRGHSVTNVDMRAFHKNGRSSKMKSIVFPDGITHIDQYAFSGLSSLETVVIPSSVTSIGYSAFYNCSSLTSFIIPSSVTYIGDEAFDGCTSLMLYCEAESKPSSWDSSWNYCNGMQLPVFWGYKGTAEFGGYTFALSELSGVKNAMVIDFVDDIVDFNPTSNINGFTVTNVNCNAFKKDSHRKTVETVVLPEGMTTIESYTFADYKSLVSITIPNSVTTIEYAAFSCCFALESIFIPINVTSMGYDVFYSCTELTIYCEAESRPEGWTGDWNYDYIHGDIPVVWGYTPS